MKDEGEDDLEALRRETSAIKADTRAMLEVTKTLGTGRRLTQNEIIAVGRKVSERGARWQLRAYKAVVMALPAPARKWMLVWTAKRVAKAMENYGFTRGDLRAIMDDA